MPETISLKTVVFLGDRSSYGNHHLLPFLNMRSCRCVAVFVPTAVRWSRFRHPADPSARGMLRERLTNRIKRTWYRHPHPNVADVEKRTVQPAKVDVESICRERGIPYCQIGSANTPSAVEAVRSLQPDWILSAAFPQIFSADLIRIARLGAINFHPSPLPHYRGRHPHYWVVRNGAASTAVTCHLLEATIDTGAILEQVPIAIDNSDYYEDVYTKINLATPELVHRLDERIGSGDMNGTMQPADAASYFSEPTRADRRLIWAELSAGEAVNRIRAGGAYCFLRGYELTAASGHVSSAVSSNQGLRPGTICNLSNGICVATKHGAVNISVLAVNDVVVKAQTLVQSWGLRLGERLA